MEKVENKVILEAVENGTAVLIDVREEREFNDFSIKGSINIPLSNYNLDTFIPYAEKSIYLICFSGNRSARVAKRLLKDGRIKSALAKDQMNILGAGPQVKGWTVDRQFRMTLGILLAVFIGGNFLLSSYFIIIPVILATGLIATSLLNKCYMRMAIAALPWNKGKS